MTQFHHICILPRNTKNLPMDFLDISFFCVYVKSDKKVSTCIKTSGFGYLRVNGILRKAKGEERSVKYEEEMDERTGDDDGTGSRHGDAIAGE